MLLPPPPAPPPPPPPPVRRQDAIEETVVVASPRSRNPLTTNSAKLRVVTGEELEATVAGPGRSAVVGLEVSF